MDQRRAADGRGRPRADLRQPGRLRHAVRPPQRRRGYAAQPRAVRRAARRAAAAAARRRSAGRHRRSRQRSDDAEHRSLARVRAAAGHRGRACAPASTSARARRSPISARRSPRSSASAPLAHGTSFLRDRGRSRSSDDRLHSAQQLEAREREILAPQAAKSADSRGRLRAEAEDDVRPAFQRDRDRIIHCKAFRRLKHKTQVFFAPTGDHYRTRLTHTLEVSQIARTIAKVLRLHEELTEAIALGHDLGHTPFGHAGERVIDALMPGGFNHYEQSLRIVDVLENDGRGLNLTWEVRDGIAKHSKGKSRRAGRHGRRRCARARSKGRSCASPTSSPTSTTTSTMRSRAGLLQAERPAARAGRACSAHSSSDAHRHAGRRTSSPRRSPAG